MNKRVQYRAGIYLCVFCLAFLGLKCFLNRFALISSGALGQHQPGSLPDQFDTATFSEPNISGPSLDPSTPASQKGCRVIAIVTGDDRGTYRFPISSDIPGQIGPTAQGVPGGVAIWLVAPNAADGSFNQASAVASSGEPVPVAIEFGFGARVARKRTLYSIVIPGGRPSAVQWIDVTFNIGSGTSARWRVTQLPLGKHVTIARSPVHTSVSAGGAVFVADAWREKPMTFPGLRANDRAGTVAIAYRIRLARGTGDYEFRIAHRTLEWEPPAPEPFVMPFPGLRHMQNADLMQDVYPVSRRQAPAPFHSIQTPFVNENRSIRLAGEIVSQSVVSETVTLRNLQIATAPLPGNGPGYFTRGRNGKLIKHAFPLEDAAYVSGRAQSVVTRNGLKVDICPASAAFLSQNPPMSMGIGSVTLILHIADARASDDFSLIRTLPQSAYYRRYHRPVQLKFESRTMAAKSQGPVLESFTTPDFANNKATGDLRLLLYYPPAPPVMNPVTHAFQQSVPSVPKVIPRLSLTIDETGYIRAYPATFNIPVAAREPADAISNHSQKTVNRHWIGQLSENREPPPRWNGWAASE